MAKYCRYCGEKMNQPKDNFCYKCRKEGTAVDKFYRKIPEEDKASLTEDEQDALRAEGIGTIACAVVIIIFLLPILYLDISSYIYGLDWKFPIFLKVFLILIIVFAVRLGIMGHQLFMLKKKAFRKKSNIILYKVFFYLVHIRSRGGSVFHMVTTLPRGLREVDKFAYLMEKLASDEPCAVSPAPQEKRQDENDDDTWKCGFCGYTNTYSNYSCKSCGKERIKERR